MPIRKDIIHQVITWQVSKRPHARAVKGTVPLMACPSLALSMQRAKRRCGLAATKRPSELRGSTKKARPQKGSGSARAGKKR